MQRLPFGEQRGLCRQVALCGRLAPLGQHPRGAQLVARHETTAALRDTFACLHHRRCSGQAQSGQHVVVQAVSTRIKGVLRAVVVDPAQHPARFMITVIGLHAQPLRIRVQICGFLEVGAQVQWQPRGQRVTSLDSRQAACQRFGHHRHRRAGVARRQHRRQLRWYRHRRHVAAGPIPDHAQHGHRRQHEQPGFQGRSEGHRRQSGVKAHRKACSLARPGSPV